MVGRGGTHIAALAPNDAAAIGALTPRVGGPALLLRQCCSRADEGGADGQSNNETNNHKDASETTDRGMDTNTGNHIERTSGPAR